MAMGTRKMRERQEDLWYGGELPKAPGHPFCETNCANFYHNKLGRPSLPPGQYFRVMMIGFFEGLDSERGIAWRLADSVTLRQFLSIGLDEKTPDHVTISRTRRLIDGETHQRVFTWVLEPLAQGGLVRGKTIPGQSTVANTQARRYYQNFKNISEVSVSGNNSHYESIQLTVERHFVRGLSILATYTHAKTMDDFGWTNPFNRRIRLCQVE